VIMTSNVGAQDIQRGLVGFGSRDTQGSEEHAFKNTFSPEFRNRLDARIGFDALAPETMVRVVDKFTKELQEQLADRNVTIELSDAARTYLAEKGFDKQNGARPLARLIQEEVKQPLGDELLFGKLENGGHVEVDHDGKALTFEIKSAPPAKSDKTDLLN